MGGFFYSIGTMDIIALYEKFIDSNGICTDSRDIFKGCIFFALKGEKFDGNQFAQAAIDLGANWAVIDNPKYENEKTILVPDTLSALQQVARFHREKLNIPIIGLTGSNGKTTTKELINAVLSQKMNAVATIGNLNNHIGVPLSLLRMREETEIGIIEMGANHKGEIGFLSEIARPNYGYITNFGKAHLEGFGSMEGVIEGKTELYKFLDSNGGVTFVNGLNIQQLKHSEGIKRIVFASLDSTYPVELIDSQRNLIIRFLDTEIHSNLLGVYNFDNIAAAVAIGAHFGLSAGDIKKGIESYIPTNNRSQIIQKGSNEIILDAYNANPTSMFAALENFKSKDGYNKVLFLGDMFELGSESDKEHQAIASYVEENFMGTTYLIGENFFKTKTNNPFILKCRYFDQLKEELKKKPPKDALILIKGSRGMALERLLDLL